MAKAFSGKNGSNVRTIGSRKTADTAAKRPVVVAPAAFHADGDIEDRIRQRAYELYEQDGRQEGRDQEYWFRAEAEVRGKRSA
ncbi:MAG TPA: DUF2934 domain-containing protein [Terriglobales bacterium]|nr:DUF2934 domain-containing protein [Terriglobales bacterium]